MMNRHRHRTRRQLTRIALDITGFVAVVLLSWYLWPASLGGTTNLVVVQGNSMEPTFELGDAVIVKDNPRPKVGDIIVFDIPDGEPGAGMRVIHRIRSIRADGSYVTQGDNRDSADTFHTTNADVMGTPVRSIPRLGRLVGLMSKPIVVAFSAGVTAAMLLWPKRRDPDRPSTGGPSTDGPSNDEAAAALTGDAEAWLDAELALAEWGHDKVLVS